MTSDDKPQINQEIWILDVLDGWNEWNFEKKKKGNSSLKADFKAVLTKSFEVSFKSSFFF